MRKQINRFKQRLKDQTKRPSTGAKMSGSEWDHTSQPIQASSDEINKMQ